ncbi:MAG: sugar kinase [Clostridiales bacterium]|nr:sugar kinase [Clostridiales bacterium]
MQAKEMIQLDIKDVRLLDMIKKIQNIRIGLVGDGCLDVYWDADMRLSKLSRETPHYPLPVVKERIYPGAGGNVAANVSSLNAGSVSMLSLIGKDWRGDCLLASLEELGINTSFILADSDWVTPAYCKPMRRGYSSVSYEDPRIDFENRVALTEKQEADIINNLTTLSNEVDVIIVCDQLQHGVISDKVREELEALASKGKTVIVDSRSRIGLYRNVIIKPNEIEAMMALEGRQMSEEADLDSITNGAIKLYEQNKAPVVITMGNKGAIWYAGDELYLSESIPVEPPIDIVGAGDTFLAAFACAYGAGFTGPECISFANLASSVVIKKIGMTGTATPEEIMEQASKIINSSR